MGAVCRPARVVVTSGRRERGRNARAYGVDMEPVEARRQIVHNGAHQHDPVLAAERHRTDRRSRRVAKERVRRAPSRVHLYGAHRHER